MSYKRKMKDTAKDRNFVAKNDFNRGGFHGKSKKAERTKLNSKLHSIDLDVLDTEYDFEDL